jgi:hypothetical protein
MIGDAKYLSTRKNKRLDAKSILLSPNLRSRVMTDTHIPNRLQGLCSIKKYHHRCLQDCHLEEITQVDMINILPLVSLRART